MQIGSKVKSGYRPDPKINKILDPNPDRTGSGPGSGKTRIFLGPGPEKKIKLWTRTRPGPGKKIKFWTRARKKDKILDPDPQLPTADSCDRLPSAARLTPLITYDGLFGC